MRIGPRHGTHAQALGRHFENRRGHEKAGAESDKIAQVALDAAGAHENYAPGDVGERGEKAQSDRELHHSGTDGFFGLD